MGATEIKKGIIILCYAEVCNCKDDARTIWSPSDALDWNNAEEVLYQPAVMGCEIALPTESNIRLLWAAGSLVLGLLLVKSFLMSMFRLCRLLPPVGVERALSGSQYQENGHLEAIPHIKLIWASSAAPVSGTEWHQFLELLLSNAS